MLVFRPVQGVDHDDFRQSSAGIRDKVEGARRQVGAIGRDQLRQIIDLGIEDLEDYYAGQEVLGRIARGDEKVLSSEEFWRGMDD